jgi:hypothetical protein
MKSAPWYVAVAALLVLVGTARIVATYPVFSHTIDEPDNIAAGLEYLTTGRYLYHDENPPLARVFLAAGPFAAGERYHPGPEAYREGLRILGTGAHYDRILALAKAGNLPFFWLASAVVFLWGLRVAGPLAAVAATAVFTALPPVLGLAGIANTDMALCAMTGVAALVSLHWAEHPTRKWSAALGVAIALAVCSKFTAIPFLAVGWAAMRLDPRKKWKEIGIVLGVAALSIWAIYGFTFARVEFLHNLRLPAPRFFTGIEKVWFHQHSGHPAFLLGKRSSEGFWWYFPVILTLKTPIPALILPIFALFGARKQASLPLAFAGGILLAATASRVDIGVRYILPVYLGLAVAAGCVLATRRTIPLLLLIWCFAAPRHPDYLAYTNEFAGSHPENFVDDSDLDWGQDMKRLAGFLRDNGITKLTFRPFNDTYPLPAEVTPGESGRPSPGWNAVSVTLWKSFGDPAWADRAPPPTVRIGRGILLWYFQSEEVAGVAVADVLDHRPDERVVVRDFP